MSTFGLKSWHITGHMHELTQNALCTKIGIFFGFTIQTLLKSPEKWDITQTSCVRNLRAKRRIRRYVWAPLRIMRGPSPTRHNYVVLLRRDVFALKICAGNLHMMRARILKGVYEVNHLAYMHIYT